MITVKLITEKSEPPLRARQKKVAQDMQSAAREFIAKHADDMEVNQSMLFTGLTSVVVSNMLRQLKTSRGLVSNFCVRTMPDDTVRAWKIGEDRQRKVN